MARGLEMVYCDQDMCESKLGRLIQAFRADRPDEWTMDEFIGMAEQMHKEIETLRQAGKDAARYRWLRDGSQVCIEEFANTFRRNRDSFVDEAMQCK